MRTLTVTFKIVTSAPGDENLSEVVAAVLKQMAEHPTIARGSYTSGDQFWFQQTISEQTDVLVFDLPDNPVGRLCCIPAQTFDAAIIATYENEYT